MWVMMSRHTPSSSLPSKERILTIRRHDTMYLTVDLPNVRAVCGRHMDVHSSHPIALVLHTAANAKPCLIHPKRKRFVKSVFLDVRTKSEAAIFTLFAYTSFCNTDVGVLYLCLSVHLTVIHALVKQVWSATSQPTATELTHVFHLFTY
jgi:hypothetical protein